MDAIITLPADFATSVLAYIGGLATGIWPLIALVIGIPLAFYVVRRVIGLFKAR